jgi:hypothetical protein
MIAKSILGCRLLPLAALVWGSLAGPVRGDFLLTSDGRLLDGVARFEDGGNLTFVQRTGPNVRVDIANLLMLTSDRVGRMECGVKLVSGGAVAAKSILELRGGRLGIVRPGGDRAEFPEASVAEVVFRPSDRAMPRGTAPGVLLASGDFFEGEILSLSGQSVVVSSNLFGERTFEVRKDVLAARFRGTTGVRDGSQWRIVHQDGSVSWAASVRVARQRLEFTDVMGARVALEREAIVELVAPAGRAVPLELGGGGGRLPSGLAAELRGTAPWTGRVATAPGVARAVRGAESVAVDLAGEYSAVFVRVGWPVGHAQGPGAVRGFRVAVLLDGVRVMRTAPLLPLGDPLMLAIPCAGGQKLELRIEVEGGGAAEVVFDAAVGVKAAAQR